MPDGPRGGAHRRERRVARNTVEVDAVGIATVVFEPARGEGVARWG